MSLRNVHQLDVATGAPPAFTAADVAGDTVISDRSGRLFFVVRNGGAGSVTVTVADPRTSETGVAIGDPTYSVAAGAERWIPLEPFFRDRADGLVHITYSGVTSVTVAAVRR